MEFRIGAGKSLLLFLCWWIVATLIGALLINIIGIYTVGRLRCAIVVQDLFVFVLPALITMAMVAVNPLRVTGLSEKVAWPVLAMVAMFAVVSIPLMNNLVAWNESVTFPESFQGLERMLRESEESAADTVNMVMAGSSVGDLILGVLIVGVLTGFSEELFFRGTLQPLLGAVMRNPHAAVWATAFIFSAVHLQFFGFVPRLLLGAFFGYLFLWSGSIWTSVFAHALNNSLVVAATWLTNRGSLEADGNEIGVGGSTIDVVMLVLSAVMTVAVVYAIKRRTSA